VLLVLALGAVALGLRIIGDRWWIGTVLLFLGRWPWLVPIAPLMLLALAARRLRTVGLTIAGLAIGLFGIMGLSVGTGRWTTTAGGPPPVRIVTFNVAGRPEVAVRLPGLVAAYAPDVLAIQECPSAVDSGLFSPNQYRIHRSNSTCLISRWPIRSVAEQPSETVRDAGGSGLVIRYRIDAPAGSFDLTNVHLDTPRDGFAALLEGSLTAPGLIRRGILLRGIESRRARAWVDAGAGPVVVVGDFNTPRESAIFRSNWGDLTEAFARAGVGFGFTRDNGWIKVRIDHVLSGPGFRPVRAMVLPDYGSDHLPLLADLVQR